MLVDADGAPLTLLGDLPADRLVRVDARTQAIKLSGAEVAERREVESVVEVVPARSLLSDRRVAKALALLDNRENQRFDSRDGSELTFDRDGRIARGASGRMIFPRTDPAVIGLIHLAGTDDVLIARNKRSNFYSLVAGFVDPGESLEEAFEREAMEETGRRVADIVYWGSQPWPPGGSLMMGFYAWTRDANPIGDTDGELADMVWVDPRTIARYPLAPVGSIARDMLNSWFTDKTGKTLENP